MTTAPIGGKLLTADEPETVAAHTDDGPTLVYTEDDELDGGAVLPDFRCLVPDILGW